MQLLQLVHGRTDESLREPGTLPALAALASGRLRGPGRRGQHGRRLPVPAHAWSTCCSSASCAAPTPCPRTRPRCAGWAGRCAGPGPATARAAPAPPSRADPAAELMAQWRQHAREARRLHEKLFYRPLLDAVARLPTDAVRLTRRGSPDPAGGPRLRRPGRRAAPHRGADLGRVPAGGHPAHAAAGDAGLVRRRRAAGRRAAGLPAGQRRARGLALVPAAAPGRHQRGRAGWPGCWPPAGTRPTC